MNKANEVMEKLIGRPLRPGEMVHHNNENHDDNDPSNLRLFNSVSEHSAYHGWLRNGCKGSEAAALKRFRRKFNIRQRRYKELENLTLAGWKQKILDVGGISDKLIDKVFGEVN